MDQEENMIRRRLKNIAAVTVLAILCSACGKQEAEKITGYGDNGTTAAAAASEENDPEKTSQETKVTEGGRTGALPAAQLSGDPIWEGNTTLDGIPVEISITQLMRDTDMMHVFRLNSVTEDRIKEKETVQNIFGDTAKEVKRTLSAEGGDSLRLIWDAGGYITQHAGDYSYEYSEKSTTESWVDNSEYFWHTYEGTYLDTDYQLGIGYSKESAEKFISLYPKNPGDVIGDPTCDRAEQVWFSVDGLNSTYWNGVFLKEVFKDRPNRTQSSEDDLCRMVMKFSKDMLYCDMSRDDLRSITGQDVGSPQTNEILFYVSKEEDNKEFPGAVLDGYIVDWDMFHSGEYKGIFGNSAYFGVTDKGVISLTMIASYEVTEELTDNAEVLKFDAVMESLSKEITENFEKSHINGQKLKINMATLIYYPVPNDEDPTECTLVPAWDFKVSSNGVIGEIILNALDGSHLSILYLD